MPYFNSPLQHGLENARKKRYIFPTMSKIKSFMTHPLPGLGKKKESLPPKNKGEAKVHIESDYPSEEVMNILRRTHTPKLRKITKTLF